MSTRHGHLPEFFKVYVSYYSAHQMLIPYQFMEHLGGVKCGAAKLTGANGETWVVMLVKEGNEINFKDGWEVFVKRNMICENDFLFFKYHGDLKFSFRVFDDETGCEKILPLHAKCGGQGIGTRGFVREETKVGSGKRVSRGVSLNKSNLGGSQAAGRVGPSLTMKEEKLQKACTIVGPFFVRKMTRHNVEEFPLLRIPASFARANSLHYQRGEKMIIRTEESSWIMNIILNLNTYVLSGGWLAFVHDNDIREGDIWTFELVDRLEMAAHDSSGGE